MKHIFYRLLLCLMLIFETLVSASNPSCIEPAVYNDNEWKIGGKIHFEEECGPDYIGLKYINCVVRNELKKLIPIKVDLCPSNAKIQLKNEQNQTILTHFEEKSKPGVAEEMHATLLYTQSRGFCSSETLKQVCSHLFERCDIPPSIEKVAKKYRTIISPEWRFKISKIVMTKSGTGTTFIIAKLLFKERENIYNRENQPISASLHLTLLNSDEKLLIDEVGEQFIHALNKELKNRFIKIAKKNDVPDLEFGISGTSRRLRP